MAQRRAFVLDQNFMRLAEWDWDLIDGDFLCELLREKDGVVSKGIVSPKL